jgi:uncharacterized membrane-anchored protein
MAPLGKLLILIGLILAFVGLVLWLGPKIPWLGKLPGDIHYEGKHVRVYFPLATCVIISVVISVLLFLLSRK